jgi:hypothetical protein
MDPDNGDIQPDPHDPCVAGEGYRCLLFFFSQYLADSD